MVGAQAELAKNIKGEDVKNSDKFLIPEEIYPTYIMQQNRSCLAFLIIHQSLQKFKMFSVMKVINFDSLIISKQKVI